MKIKLQSFLIGIVILLIAVGLVYLLNGVYQNKELFRGIEDSNLPAVQKAIDQGAFVNKRKSWLYVPEIVSTNPTPLITACKIGNEEIVKVLIENGANINKKDNYTDNTPLLAALDDSKPNRFSLAMYLIENGADIYAIQDGVNSPFYQSLYISSTDNDETMCESVSLLDYLLNNNVDQTIYMSGENPLTFSAHYRNTMAVQYLVENNYYGIDSYDYDGNTALIVATKNQDRKMVELLLDLGAAKHLKDVNGKTALDYAIENYCEEIIGLLKTAGGTLSSKKTE